MNIEQLNDKVNGGFDDLMENPDNSSVNKSFKKNSKKKSSESKQKVSSDIEDKNEDDEYSLDYLYITRVDEKNNELINEYRKADGGIYIWTGEYWKYVLDEEIKEDINNWLKKNHPSRLNSKNINSIFNVFYLNVSKFIDVKMDCLIIPTKNFWLAVNEKTGDIKAIKPVKEIDIRYQVNVKIKKLGPYRPKKLLSENSLFKKYITSSLPDFEARKLVQEYAGYTLTNTTRKQKAQAWVGGGANGKSQLIIMLQSIHPQSISVKLSTIGQYNTRLIGSSLIFATEMDKGAFDQEFFKGAVSGDCVELRGIYSAPVQAELKAKWILIGNTLPTINDFSDGVFRRLQIINWKESFKDSKNKIEDLGKTVIEDELDIFLDWCLDGLQSLIKAKWTFTESKDSQVALEDYKLNQDKVKLYFSENGITYDEENKMYMTKDSIFDSYNEWSRKNNFALVSSSTFWQRVRNLFPSMQKDSVDLKKNGKRICYLYSPVVEDKPSNIQVKPVKKEEKITAPNPEDAPDFDPFASNYKKK